MHMPTFKIVAPRLADNAWLSTLPLKNKVPLIGEWSRYSTMPVSEAELASWCSKYPYANIGLAIGHDVIGVDLDILEPAMAVEIAAVADEILGETDFIRIGVAPKQLRLYRGSVTSRKLHPIEVFGSSGQVVLYGLHPGTRRPYAWPFNEPLYASPGDLPLVDEQMMTAFLAEATGRLVQKGMLARAARSGATVHHDVFAGLRQERKEKRGKDWLETVVAQLRAASQGSLHNTMVSIVATLVARGYTDRQILVLFDENFAAPRVGPYAPVWQQIPPAIDGARRRFKVPEATSIAALSSMLGVGGVR